eukprot:s344_g19.t2
MHFRAFCEQLQAVARQVCRVPTRCCLEFASVPEDMQPQARGTKRLVAILSFALESNVFNPTPRRLSDFQVLHGEEYERNDRQAGFVRRLRTAEPDLFLDAEDLPSRGKVYNILWHRKSKVVVMRRPFSASSPKGTPWKEQLGAPGELDGVCLDLHGAMGASGSDDPEAEMAEAVTKKHQLG